MLFSTELLGNFRACCQVMEYSSVFQLILLCFICKRMSMIYASSSRSSSNCILPTLFCLPWKIMLLESDMMESGSSFSEDLGTNFFSTICLGTRLLSAIRRFSARNDDSFPHLNEFLLGESTKLGASSHRNLHCQGCHWVPSSCLHHHHSS